MCPASYKRCAFDMVLLTEKPSFREASCCKVEVVKGAVGDLLAGFFSKFDTAKAAPMFCDKKAFASSAVS